MLSSSNADYGTTKNKSTKSYKPTKGDSNAVIDLERKITLAKGQKKVDLVIRNAKINFSLVYAEGTVQ
jgi:hypothetical protein